MPLPTCRSAPFGLRRFLPGPGLVKAAASLVLAAQLAPATRLAAAEPTPPAALVRDAAGKEVTDKSGKEKAPDHLVTVVHGGLPIILSAPHGGREAPPAEIPARRGDGVRKFTAVRDDNTYELAERLAAAVAKRLGAKPHLVAARFERKFIDPNRPARDAYEVDAAKPYYDAYHQALAAACGDVQKKYGWGLLVDLHGQAADAEAVFRGTQNRKSVSHLTRRFGGEALVGPRSVLGVLAAPPRGWKVVPSNDSDDAEDPRYEGGFIVRSYGSREGGTVDALQLELGGAFRRKNRLDRTADELAEALVVFHKAYLPQTPRAAGGGSKKTDDVPGGPSK